MATHTFSNATGTIILTNQEIGFGQVAARTVGLYPGTSNTCVVEITIEDNPADGGAVWHAWDSGEVTANTLDVLYANCTGIRARRTVGSAGGNRLIIVP